MDTFQEYLKIKEELNNSFKFHELRFKPDGIAEFIMKHQGEVPFKLVYKTADGGTESDHKIRENLNGLVGFELYYKDKTYVVLTKVITGKDLQDVENATVGELRAVAKQIHPNAMPINNIVAALMWRAAPHFYTMKYLFMKREIELPDIQVLSSIRSDESDDSPFTDWNSSCGYWDYLDEEGGSGRIEGSLPIWCYYIVEQWFYNVKKPHKLWGSLFKKKPANIFGRF